MRKALHSVGEIMDRAQRDMENLAELTLNVARHEGFLAYRDEMEELNAFDGSVADGIRDMLIATAETLSDIELERPELWQQEGADWLTTLELIADTIVVVRLDSMSRVVIERAIERSKS